VKDPVRTEPDKIRNFIDGRFVEPIGAKYLDNIEPATGKPYSQVADSDAHDVDLAVAAAEKAFRDWSIKTAAERSNFLLRIADLIERDLEKFARAESIDTGKPIMLARSLDIPRAVANFRFFATAILHTGARHRRIDFAVEPAALFVELEDRSGHRCRKHRHREAERVNADDGFHAL
jgi:acyl-CoA reductase-like NAD-dependent aldehyde dehydrogenase